MPEIPAALIDVLSADSFALEHLPGAVNLCVYETAFLEKVKETFPDPATQLTVYGLNDQTGEAPLALKKLKSAGYLNVTALKGGLEGHKASGGEVSIGQAGIGSDGTHRIDLEKSVIGWAGQNLLNQHHGALRLKSGEILVRGGQIESGHFEIDMTSLGCSDLSDSQLNSMLIAHLSSDDFFSIDRFPTAEFAFKSVKAVAGATPGSPNFRIEGELTLRGSVHPLEFSTIAGKTPEGLFAAQARIEFDRTLWGSKYGSGKFFARLGQHLVNDLVYLHLKIVTLPKG